MFDITKHKHTQKNNNKAIREGLSCKQLDKIDKYCIYEK